MLQKATLIQFSLRTLLLVTIALGFLVAFFVQRSQSQRYAAQARALEELREEGKQEIRKIENSIRRGKSALRSGGEQIKECLWNIGERSIWFDGNPEGEARLDGLRLQLSGLTDRYGNDHQDAHMLKKTISAWERFYKIQRPSLSKQKQPKKQLELYLQDLENRQAELLSTIEESTTRLEKLREMSYLVE